MEDLTTVWRPRGVIRPVAIGVPFSGGAILAAAVTEDDGTRKGWRPLGGGIEFGETAEAAVLREFHEELQARARVLRRIGIIENLFEHHDAQGHEIVFAFELALEDAGIAKKESFCPEGPRLPLLGRLDRSGAVPGR